MYHNNNELLEFIVYYPALKRLKNWLENQKQQNDETYFLSGLEAYGKLLSIRDRGFPLLLCKGQSRRCSLPPFAVHLLPPFKDQRNNVRWLLSLAATEQGQLQVELFEWSPNVTEEEHVLRQLSVNCVDSDDSKNEFPPNRRPLHILFHETRGRCYIQVIFQQGSLDLTADTAKGIIALAWISESTAKSCRAERGSFGDMRETVYVQSHDDIKGWRDDSILDEKNQSLVPQDFKPGWINGADSPSNQPNWVYLASSQTKVFRVDKDQPDQKPWETPRMAGMVLDVLAVVDVDNQNDVGHGVLAATQNGKIYFLTADDKSQSLKIKYWQPTGDHHVVRLIGFGGLDVVAIDEQGELLPLRLSSPEAFVTLKNQATQQLSDYFIGKPEYELTRVLAAGWLENEPDRLRYHARLSLELNLLNLQNNAQLTESIRQWCEWLTTEDVSFSSQQRAKRTEIHAELICMLIRGRHKAVLPESEPNAPHPLSLPQFDLLCNILTPHKSAPDYLWLPLLRNSDWVRLWLEQTRLLDNPSFSRRLEIWENQLQEMRKQFLPGLAEMRPLVTGSSRHLRSHANHIEVIDASKGLIAVSEYAYGIRIYRLRADPERWEQCAELPAEQLVDGQILFVRALPNLAGKKTEGIPLLLGTVRGELRLLLYDDQSARLTSAGKPIDCEASIICARDAPTLECVLLGGHSPNRQAVLYAWSYPKLKNCLNGSREGPTQIWRDSSDHSGSLRLIRLSQDGKRLWAINRNQGRLYAWTTLPTPFNRVQKLPDPSVWHQTIHKLHALEACQEQSLLACGGEGGMTVAYGDRAGECRWVVNGSGNIRRIRFLPFFRAPTKSGAWLLCGHHQSSLIVDDDANVLGVLEKAGPVSAAAIIPAQNGAPAKLLLATQEGRLMAMNGYSSASTDPPANTEVLLALPKDAAAYPVRLYRHPLDPEWLQAMLEIPEDSDSLSTMCCLKSCIEYLKANEDLSAIPRITSFFAKQPPERRVVFLYWLRNACKEQYPNETLAHLVLALSLEIITWVKQNSEINLLCKILSPLFDCLDALKERKERARELREELAAWLWTPPDAVKHYLPYHRSSALAATCWNQAAKRWREISGDAELTEPEVLSAWCNAMAKECGAQNVTDLQRRLLLLTQWEMSFLPQGSLWRGWLPNVLRKREQQRTPLPLLSLEIPRARPFTGEELERLTELFKNNTTWERWLISLQERLSGLVQVGAAPLHNARREYECLEALRDWILSIGKHRFSVEQEQALLALWWPRMEQNWTKFIDEKRQQLHSRWVGNRIDYVPLQNINDRWRSANRVELRLDFINRSPEDLLIDAVGWSASVEAEAMLNSEPAVPIFLPTADVATGFVILVHTAQAGLLAGALRLDFRGIESGEKFDVLYPPIEKKRNVERLSDETQWHPSWERLNRLLAAQDENDKTLLWLEGSVWTEEEKRLLKIELSVKYGCKPKPIDPRSLLDSLEQPGAITPLFSPDLALGGATALQLEQIHDIVAAMGAEVAPLWLLGLWNTRHRIPETVRRALNRDHIVPSAESMEQLLVRLGLEAAQSAAVLGQLGKLPGDAVGLWCSSEPFSWEKQGDDKQNAVVSSPASSLPAGWWRIFDAAEVPDADLAEFLTLDTENSQTLRRRRAAFYAVASMLFAGAEHVSDDVEAAVKALLNALEIEVVNTDAGLWWGQGHITLNWDDYSHCIVLPKSSATARAQARAWARNRTSSELLWLCLGETRMPDDWPGLTINLTSDQALSLLHTRDKAEAQRRLNQWCADQHKPFPEKVFKSVGGLGPERIKKHFGGRDDELKKLRHYLDAGDRGETCSALLLGGRRMGKTTLREKILSEQAARRSCLVLNWEGIGDEDNRRGIGLEYWFMNALKKPFQVQLGIDFEPDWSRGHRNDKSARSRARDRLRTLLDKLKANTGHTPLFIFDETENLVRLDAPTMNPKEPWSLFKFLRELINEKRLALFATCYPFGLDASEALNVACYNSHSPLVNTFLEPIRIGAWSPHDAWDYLYQKLSGLGVLLPPIYRDEYLNLGRGIPWIAHEFGLKLCKHLPEGRRIVDAQIWRQAKHDVLEEIFKSLKIPADKVRDELKLRKDSRFFNEEWKALDGLWQAFLELGATKHFAPKVNIRRWPDEPERFTFAELHALLPGLQENTLRDVLRYLSSSPIVNGIESQKDQFYFANNLLLAWMHYREVKET